MMIIDFFETNEGKRTWRRGQDHHRSCDSLLWHPDYKGFIRVSSELEAITLTNAWIRGANKDEMLKIHESNKSKGSNND